MYDAQLNVGPTAFDDSGEEDQDLGNFGGTGATTSKMAIPEGLTREQSDLEYDDLSRRHSMHDRYARSGLIERARDLEFDAQYGFSPRT